MFEQEMNNLSLFDNNDVIIGLRFLIIYLLSCTFEVNVL
jgi:hypothetical protein